LIVLRALPEKQVFDFPGGLIIIKIKALSGNELTGLFCKIICFLGRD